MTSPSPQVVKPYRLGKNLPPNSCEGEPAPSLDVPAAEPAAPKVLVLPKEDLKGLCAPDSIGELLAVDEPERG